MFPTLVLVALVVLGTAVPAHAGSAKVTKEPAKGAKPATTTYARNGQEEACAAIAVATAFQRGERQNVSFWMSGEARIDEKIAPALPIVATPSDSRERVGRFVVTPGAWREVRFSWVPENNAVANSVSLRFCLVPPWESVTFGPFTFGASGAGAPTAEPPTTEAWRVQARERVRRRWGVPAVLTVLDRNRPARRGLDVQLVLRRPDFHLGTAVDAATFVRDDEAGRAYRKQIHEHFDTITFENALKWPRWEADRDLALRAVALANTEGFRVRGHTLLWPGWQRLPAALDQLSDKALRERIQAHIVDEVTALRGRIALWDVVNEPAFEREVLDRLGDSTVTQAFGWAAKAKPEAELALNEVFRPGELDEQRFKRVNSIVGRPIASPEIQSLGVQAHYAWRRPAIGAVVADLDRLSRYGRPMDITEWDFSTFDETEKARFLEEYLLAAAGHASVRSFTLWGFRADLHWRAAAAIAEADGTPRAAMKALANAPVPKVGRVYRGKLGKDGRLTLPVFSGEYDVTVAGTTKRLRFDHGNVNATMVVGETRK